MATVELVANSASVYFSFWRNGVRKLGDDSLKGCFYWGQRREDAGHQQRNSDVAVAYGPVLEWTE